MLKNAPRILALCCLISPCAALADSEGGGEIVVAQEVAGQTYHFSAGKMKPASQAQLEITYRIKDGKIIRSRVFDLVKKEVIADDTVYTVESKTAEPKKGQPLMRATGKSSAGITELLEIGDTYVQSVRSEDGKLVISRMKRTDTVALPELAGVGAALDGEPVLMEDAPSAPEAAATPVARTTQEQKAYDEGHASGISLNETGKFTPYPKTAPANEREAWFQGFKVGLNEQARRQNENSTAMPADAGE